MSSSTALPYDDYYAILNLPRTASLDDIRHAYRTLGPAVHPDKLHHTLALASVSLPPSYPLASTFHRVQRAAAVLSDPLTRWAWDEYGEEGARVAEKMRARLAWRTEQSARDFIARTVQANSQRAGANKRQQEERREAEEDDDDDVDDGSAKQSGRRLGPGLLSLQSLSSSSRVVYSLNAFRLFGYRQQALSPVVSQLFGLPFNKSLSYYTHGHHTTLPAAYHPSSLNPLPLLLASHSLRHAVDVRLSDSVTLNVAAEVSRRGASTASSALSTGVQGRWRGWTAGVQAVTSTTSGGRSSSKRGLSGSVSYNVSPLMQVEVESGYEWRGGSAPSLWPQTSVSVHRAFDASSHTSASVSLSPFTVSSLDWSYASPLFAWRGIDQELSCSVSGEKLAVEQRLSYHLDVRKRLKVYVKASLSIPHNLTSTSQPTPSPQTASSLSPHAPLPAAPPASSLFVRFEPSVTFGSQYSPSPSHSIGLWVSAAQHGVMAGVSYRFTSFSLTLPVQLTPQYDNKALAVGLLLPFGLLVASRAAWLWHERRRRQRDWQRHLNPTAQQLLARRLAVREHMLSFRHAARASRRQQRRSGGVVIVYARWVWSDEGVADESMLSSIDVRDALQARVDGEGRLLLDRAADVLGSAVDASAEAESAQQGSLYVRWRRGGKECTREWKDDAAVVLGEEIQQREEEEEEEARREGDEVDIWDDLDLFW